MAYTYDIRTDTGLVLEEYQTLLADTQQKLALMEAQSKHIAKQLHDEGCSNGNNLTVGLNCCDANMWVHKSRRVTECAIYAYKVIGDAPHAIACYLSQPEFRDKVMPATECNCWKSKGMENMITFFQAISNEK